MGIKLSLNHRNFCGIKSINKPTSLWRHTNRVMTIIPLAVTFFLPPPLLPNLSLCPLLWTTSWEQQRGRGNAKFIHRSQPFPLMQQIDPCLSSVVLLYSRYFVCARCLSIIGCVRQQLELLLMCIKIMFEESNRQS